MEEQEKKEHHEDHEHHENHEKKEHHEHQEKKEEHQEKEHEKKEEHHEKKEHEKGTPPTGEKKDLRDSRISILVFTLAGAAMALLSSILKSSGLSSYIAVAPGFLVLVALLLGMQKAFRRRIKFFYASLFVCLLVWLVFWIFLYNM